MKRIASLILMLSIGYTAFAQYQIGLIPRISPDRSISQKVGYTEIEVSYGSPAVKNRQIWGALVPYDQVWRAGANSATTVGLSSDVKIGNMTVDSGRYSLFVIPREDQKWTVVFNRISDQWGAFRYKEEEDALRIEVVPRRNHVHTERLTYTISQLGHQYGSIVLRWEYVEIEIPFETNYLDEFIAAVESEENEQEEYIRWIVYVQGAEHLQALNSSLEVANDWINQAEITMEQTSEWNAQFSPREYVKWHLYWTKAKILASRQAFPAAIKYVGKLKNLTNQTFYERQNEEEGIDSSSTSWMKQE